MSSTFRGALGVISIGPVIGWTGALACEIVWGSGSWFGIARLQAVAAASRHWRFEQPWSDLAVSRRPPSFGGRVRWRATDENR